MKALIIDDESLARFTLKNKLVEFPDIEILGEASSVKEAADKIKHLDPDLIFLDVQMNDGTGFDLLNQIEYTGKIIFVTAFDEYALRAFEINAVDYLLKPISSKRLKEAIERLSAVASQLHEGLAQKLNYNDRLMVMHKQSVNFIKIDQITSINAAREYTFIRTIDGREYLAGKTISQWEQRLPDQHFCRIHRSTIINFDYILKIEHHISGSAEVIIQGNPEPLFISRNYFKVLKQRYSL
ncbi:MAG: LytTR family DNA-binding domain-containing protein [Bacteroidota bacterium]